MKILHRITYSTRSMDGQIRREQSTQLTRQRRLTVLGCERLLKRSDLSAIVTRVETFVDAR